MDFTGEKIWFVDTRGNTFPRSELVRALDDEPWEVGPMSGTHTILLEIAKALASGADLSLAAGRTSGVASAGIACTRNDSPSEDVDAWERLQRGAAGESCARFEMLTSGSTGIPKLVWQPVRQLARAVRVSARHAAAVWGLAYPPTHVAGVQVVLQAFANGCPLVDLQGLSASKIAATIERHGVTHLSATPTFYRLLLTSVDVIDGVRSVTLGGEPVDADLINRLKALFPNARIHNVYASTEAGTLLVSDGNTFSIPEALSDRIAIRSRCLWVHRSLLGEFVGGKPAREQSEGQRFDEARDSESGHGPDGLNKGGGKEIGRPEGRLTNKAVALGANEEQEVVNPMDDWYDTGDRVEVIEQAPLRFRIVGRDRDWLNVGGQKVNPKEVERVLERFPGVNRARVSGRANSVVGTMLVAELELREGAEASEVDVRAFAAEHLQNYQVPRLIKRVAKLPSTWTGKLKRE